MSGCDTVVTYENVSDKKPFNQLIGKKYTILKNCYLIRVTKNKDDAKFEKDSDISLWLCGTDVLPDKLDESKIGKTIKGIKIVGIVPEKSKFTLIRTIQMNMDSNIHFKVILPIINLSNSKFSNVEASALLQKYTEKFAFDKQLVKEIQASEN